MTALVTVNRRPLTEALKAALIADGVPCEIGRAPTNAGSLDFYTVLYPIEAGGFVGPPSLPESDATFCFQTTTVAKRGDQIEAVGDKVRRLMMSVELTLVNMTIMSRWAVAAGGIDRETSVLSLPERFYFMVTTS